MIHKMLLNGILFITLVVVVIGAPPSNNSTKPTTIQTHKVAPKSSASRGNIGTQAGSSISGKNNATHVRVRRDQDSKASNTAVATQHLVKKESPVSSVASSNHRPPLTRSSTNSSKPVKRSSDGKEIKEEVKGESAVASKQSSEESSHHELPTTHPLFANRHTSNITDVLRPKLRATPSNKQTGQIGSEEANHPVSTGSDHSFKSKSAEEITVVSSNPVGFQGKNSTLKGGISSSSNKQTRPKEETDEEF